MTELWMVPDPEEQEFVPRHNHLPALPVAQQREIAYRVRLTKTLPVGDRRRIIDHIARDFGVTARTADRYAGRSYLCPGYPHATCMTWVRGGGLCSFCRKSPNLTSPVARMGTSRIELHNARIPDDLPVVLNPLPGGRSAPSGLRR